MNYMNLEEIRGFCAERRIPYRIVAEYPDGRVKVTKDTDRKPIVLARVRHYLRTGDAGQATCIPVKIVREENQLMTPEYAYLTDLQNTRAGGDWKALRKAKARSALDTLAHIATPSPL